VPPSDHSEPSKAPPRWLLLPYAAWACTAFLLLGLMALLAILPVPSLPLRRRMARRAARLALRAMWMPLEVRNLEHLPETPCVVVANHGSYLDGVVLFAALPPTFGFVIKREMSNVPVANLLLRRIGSHYVDRGGSHKGARDTRKLLKRANAGGALAFFPEGTFRLERGLGQFRSGAFVVAAKAQLPIVPVAISGTRLALPSGTFIPRPVRITVELTPQVPPPVTTQQADLAVARRASRQAILARIDEPDLAPED
jgi:1-acyl-sn-glycerol-3-phosphate acyltransferase